MRCSKSACGRLLLAALLASGLAACAGGQKRAAAPTEWPLPPEPPRVRFVRAFSKEEDLGGGVLRSVSRAFVPASPDLVVTQPTGLALSPDEKTLYVSSNASSKVLRVDLEKGTMRRFASVEGKSPRGPFGVAVDAEGNVYVSDHVANWVWVYAPDGSFLRRFGEGHLERATGIAIDRRRQLVYVTAGASSRTTHHRVEVFSLQGEHLRTVGTRGHEAGQFNFPANLAVGRDGNLHVVDMLNFRVQIFDPEGRLVAMFGTLGSGRPGLFDKAKSVAFDSFGNLYVVDSQQANVQLFNPRFQPLMAFGGRARAPGFFSLPTAIAIDSRNRIYVADFGAGTVNEYQLINTSEADSYVPAAEPKGPAAPKTSEKPQGG